MSYRAVVPPLIDLPLWERFFCGAFQGIVVLAIGGLVFFPCADFVGQHPWFGILVLFIAFQAGWFGLPIVMKLFFWLERRGEFIRGRGLFLAAIWLVCAIPMFVWISSAQLSDGSPAQNVGALAFICAVLYPNFVAWPLMVIVTALVAPFSRLISEKRRWRLVAAAADKSAGRR